MSDENLTRRDFIAGLATSGTVAALADAQTPHSPLVVANYPIVEREASNGPIKMVCAEKLTPAEVEQIRSAGKNIDLHMLSDRAELKNHVAEAEVIIGMVDSEA
ncbi:MAG: twin-arginine translocation signal domain-containing protein, partial [Blastocatellia bacterium]|nr:twin-arginine translocation signal domain-containing protein [Blastocatellia bacterium]